MVEACSAYYLEWNRNRMDDKPSEEQTAQTGTPAKIEELNQLACRYGISPAPEMENSPTMRWLRLVRTILMIIVMK